MGVALSETVGRSYESMYRAADAALYASKRSGKKQIHFYDPSMKNILDADPASKPKSAGKGGA